MSPASERRKPRAPRRLSEDLFKSLRRAILRGELIPGSRLIEEKTAQRFGASRTPVREAFLKLSLEGLVDRRKQGGFVVSRLGFEEMDEIMDVRAVLEGHAAARAAMRADGTMLGRLRSALDRYQAAVSAGDISRMIEANTEFHDLLYQASGSRRLKSMIEDLRDFFYRLRRPILGLKGMDDQSLRDHEQMMLAIAAGDAPLAERLVREHINRARQALRDEIQAGRLQL